MTAVQHKSAGEKLAAGVRSAARIAGRRQARGGALVLAYHDVVEASAAPYDSLHVTAAELRRDIRLLQASGFTVVSLAELQRRLRTGLPVDGLAALTFDDALVGVHRHGIPVLLELGVPSTVFVVTEALGSPPPWWPGNQRIMTTDELDELAVANMTIGLHTHTHASMHGVGEAAVRDELQRNQAAIASLPGADTTLLAWPFGHHDNDARSAAQGLGVALGFTFLNGRITGDEDPLMLPRLTMVSGTSRLRLALQVARAAADWPDHQAAAVSGPAGTRPASVASTTERIDD